MGVGFFGAGGAAAIRSRRDYDAAFGQRNRRLDIGGLTERHIGLAEITIVGQQRFGSADFRQELIAPSIGATCCLSFGA